MGNELTVKKEELISLVSEQGLSTIIKPLMNEIHLFDTHVAGTSYLEDKNVLKDIKVNDKLLLQREDNLYDEKAILVYSEEHRKVGYIPAKDNIIFSRLMDAGKLLVARVSEIEEKNKNYTKVSIGIYLVDY